VNLGPPTVRNLILLLAAIGVLIAIDRTRRNRR